MKRHWITLLIGSTALFAAALQRTLPKPDEEVTGSYEGEGGKIDLLGVCSITPDKAECWDGQGAMAPALSRTVAGLCQSNTGNDMQFKFGRKNRVVVFRSTFQLNNGFSMSDGNYAQGVYWMSNSESPMSGIRVATAMDEKTTSLLATVNIAPLQVELPFKLGEKTNSDLGPIEFGPAKPADAPTNPYNNGMYYNGMGPGGQSMPGKYWSVVLGMDTKENEYPQFSYVAFDKDHKQIRYVDLKGEPISGLTFLALGGNPNGQYNYPMASNGKPQPKPQCAMLSISQQASAVGAIKILMNVNPERVAYLQISKARQKRILFKDIPLDPKE